MATKIEMRFNQISFKKIDDVMGRNASMEIAYATRFQRSADCDCIEAVFHQTPIVKLQGVTITLNTDGYASMATREKMNMLLQGHGYVMQERGKWFLSLRDYSVPKNPADPGRGAHRSYSFFDGISFDVNSHQVNDHARPTVTELEFAELFKAYRFLGGAKRAPNIAQGVTIDVYDKWLKETIKLYAAGLEYGTVGTVDGMLGCEGCALAWARLERMEEEGLFKSQFYGSVTAETKLGIVREVMDDDLEHLREHLFTGDYNGDMVYLAFIVFDRIDADNYNYKIEQYPEMIRKDVKRFLMRMLAKGVRSA